AGGLWSSGLDPKKKGANCDQHSCDQRARSGGLWSGSLDLKRGVNRDQHSRDQRGRWFFKGWGIVMIPHRPEWFMKYSGNVRRTVVDFLHAPLNEYSSSPNDKKQWSLLIQKLRQKGVYEEDFSRHAAWIGGKLIQLVHTTMVPEQVKTMKIQAVVQGSRPEELRRQLQLWKTLFNFSVYILDGETFESGYTFSYRGERFDHAGTTCHITSVDLTCDQLRVYLYIDVSHLYFLGHTEPCEQSLIFRFVICACKVQLESIPEFCAARADENKTGTGTLTVNKQDEAFICRTFH
ncbi:hypothetical protein Tco_0787204, partial [Tanacetum coccineum]